MLKQIVERFTAEFGHRSKETKYVQGWEPRVDVGVAVEREGQRTKSFAWVWVPHPGSTTGLPPNAVQYVADRGRNSNTYSLPGLKKGMPALRVKVLTPDELDEIVRFIRGLPAIRSYR